MTISHVTRLSQPVDQNTVLVQGYDYTGKNAWYVLKLHRLKASLFDADMAKGIPTDLTNYGLIINSSYGTPPDTIIG